MPKYEILPPKKQAPPLASENSLPRLPASSGAIFGNVLKKDTAYVEQHVDFLRARSAQAAAMTDLINKRHDLALAIARLGALHEIAEHEYRLGRADRDHDRKIQAIRHELLELQEIMTLVTARKTLESMTAPPPAPPAAVPPPAPAPPSLSVDDVERVASAIPELADGGTLETLLRALKGILAEKQS